MDEQNTQDNIVPTPEISGTPESGGTGAVVGSLIVIILIVVGGIYFLLERTSTSPAELIETPPTEDSLAAELSVQSDSNEIAAIEADLDATDLDALDDELKEIDALLDADLADLEAAL